MADRDFIDRLMQALGYSSEERSSSLTAFSRINKAVDEGKGTLEEIRAAIQRGEIPGPKDGSIPVIDPSDTDGPEEIEVPPIVGEEDFTGPEPRTLSDLDDIPLPVMAWIGEVTEIGWTFKGFDLESRTATFTDFQGIERAVVWTEKELGLEELGLVPGTSLDLTDAARANLLNLQTSQLRALLDPNLIPLDAQGLEGRAILKGTDLIVDLRASGIFMPVQGVDDAFYDPVSGQFIDRAGNVLAKDKFEFEKLQLFPEEIRQFDVTSEEGIRQFDITTEEGRRQFELKFGQTGLQSAAEAQLGLQGLLDRRAEVSTAFPLQGTESAGDLEAQLQGLLNERGFATAAAAADPGRFIEREFLARGLQAPEAQEVPLFGDTSKLAGIIDQLLATQAPEFGDTDLLSSLISRLSGQGGTGTTAGTPTGLAGTSTGPLAEELAFTLAQVSPEFRAALEAGTADVEGSIFDPAFREQEAARRQTEFDASVAETVGGIQGGGSFSAIDEGGGDFGAAVRAALGESEPEPAPEISEPVPTTLESSFDASTLSPGTIAVLSDEQKALLGLAHGGKAKGPFIAGDPQVPGVPNPELVIPDKDGDTVVPLNKLLPQRANSRAVESTSKRVPPTQTIQSGKALPAQASPRATEAKNRQTPDLRSLLPILLGLRGFAHGTGQVLPAEGRRRELPHYAHGTGVTTTTEPTAPVHTDETFQNLPVLQFLQGNLSPEQFGTLATGTAPGAFGTQIPEAGQININKLQDILIDPVSTALLEALFRSASRNLGAESARARARAPIGTARQTSVIRT